MYLGGKFYSLYLRKNLSLNEDPLSKLPGGILETGLTDMPQCMPDEYKDDCSIQAYWNYYIHGKKDIANLYIEHNLLEKLFPITTSCESLDNVTEHCGECWWCKERQWAFNRLT